MPLRDFRCTSCHFEQERFYHANGESLAPRCIKCEGRLEILPRSSEGQRRASVFPFTTTHIDAKGRPMEITSMAHLRQVERDYGVVLSAFSNEVNNSCDGIKDLPKYRGQDLEHRRGRQR